MVAYYSEIMNGLIGFIMVSLLPWDEAAEVEISTTNAIFRSE